MRIRFWQILLPVILGVITLYYFVYRDRGINLRHKDYLWIIYGSLIIILWWISEATKLSMISNIIGIDIGFLNSLRIVFAGFFFGSVTAFSIGTFPGEYVSLIRIGVDADRALGIVSIRGIINGIVKGIIAVTIAFFLRSHRNPVFKDIFYTIFLTYGLGVFLTYFIIFGKNVYSAKIRNYITRGLIFLEKRYRKISGHISNFRLALISQSEKNYIDLSHKWLPVLFIYLSSCIILFSFPISIVKFTGSNIRLIDVIVAQAIFYITQSYMPTPGGSGIVELGYDYFLRSTSGAGSTEFIIFLRFFTFYLPLMVGGLITFSLLSRRRIV